MAQVNLQKVNIANNAPVGKLGIFVTPDNEAFLIDENGAVYAFGGGASSFLALTDTPINYIGQALKALRVNAGATGLEFVDFPEGFDGNPSSLNQEGAEEGQAIVWDGTVWAPANVAADITAEDGLKKIGTIITLGDDETLFFTPISAPAVKDGFLGHYGSLQINLKDKITFDIYNIGEDEGYFDHFNTFGNLNSRITSQNTLNLAIQEFRIDGSVLTSYIQNRNQDNSSGSASITSLITLDGGGNNRRVEQDLSVTPTRSLYLLKVTDNPSFLDFYELKIGQQTGGVYEAKFTDNINLKGFEYGADYSANFTARSLVDKGYVDTALGSASQLVTNQPFNFVTNTVTLDFIPDDMLYVGLNGQLTDEWVLVGDELTVTNFTEGFIIVGYYKAIVIGGATVQTVTGAGVDNTDPENPVIGYQPSTLLDSNTVPFDKDYIMGLTARTGNVLFDFTNAELGATSVMPHQDLSAFTIPIEAKQISGTYDGDVLNYLDFQLIDKTIGSEVVRLTISQEQP